MAQPEPLAVEQKALQQAEAEKQNNLQEQQRRQRAFLRQEDVIFSNEKVKRILAQGPNALPRAYFTDSDSETSTFPPEENSSARKFQNQPDLFQPRSRKTFYKNNSDETVRCCLGIACAALILGSVLIGIGFLPGPHSLALFAVGAFYIGIGVLTLLTLGAAYFAKWVSKKCQGSNTSNVVKQGVFRGSEKQRDKQSANATFAAIPATPDDSLRSSRSSGDGDLEDLPPSNYSNHHTGVTLLPPRWARQVYYSTTASLPTSESESEAGHDSDNSSTYA